MESRIYAMRSSSRHPSLGVGGLGRALSSSFPDSPLGMADAGRLLLVAGVLMVIVGGALMLFGRFQLPGDFTFRSGNVTVYIPVATSIIISVVLTIVLNLLFRHR